jgi:hypothetical protein
VDAPPAAAALLLGPGGARVPRANLFDWPWHVPAAGAVFALALGGLIAAPAREPSKDRQWSDDGTGV